MRLVRKKKNQEPVSLGKRFYMPGVVLEDKCPECGEEWALDLGRDYPEQYMCTETEIPIEGYCSNCDNAWVAGYIAFHISVEHFSR